MDTSELSHVIATFLSYVIVYGGLFVALPIFLFKHHKKKKQQQPRAAQQVIVQHSNQKPLASPIQNQEAQQAPPPPDPSTKVPVVKSLQFKEPTVIEKDKPAIRLTTEELNRFIERQEAEMTPQELKEQDARIKESVKAMADFERAQHLFEILKLLKFKYQKYKVWRTLYVYVVEDSAVFSIELLENKDAYLSYSVKIRELTYNNFFSGTKTQLKKELFVNEYEFFDPYDNSWEPQRIDSHLPEIDLIERLAVWEGQPNTFIVFEVEDKDGNIGRASYYSTSKEVTKLSHEAATEIQSRLAAQYIDEMKKQIGLYEYIHDIAVAKNLSIEKSWLTAKKKKTSMPIRIDETFKRVMFERIILSSAAEVKIKNDVASLFDENVKWFSVTHNIKSSKSHIVDHNMAFLQELNHGSYHDVERKPYTPIVGKWKNEEIMYQCIRDIFKDRPVIYQHHPFFLDRQSYDVFVPGLDIAFEYQGKQHFEPVEFFGGEENFKGQVERDKRKKELSDKNGITLIYVNYDEEVTEELIRKKIAEAGIELQN